MILQNAEEFYNSNKHINFEDMSCLMVDILKKLLKKPDISLDSTFAEKLLTSMNNLDSKITNIDQCMSDVFENKFIEFKKSYTQELNTILTSNNNERTASMLKEYNEVMQDKTKIFFNEFFPKNNEAIALQLNNSFNITTQLINSTESRLALQINENNININENIKSINKNLISIIEFKKFTHKVISILNVNNNNENVNNKENDELDSNYDFL